MVSYLLILALLLAPSLTMSYYTVNNEDKYFVKNSKETKSSLSDPQPNDKRPVKKKSNMMFNFAL